MAKHADVHQLDLTNEFISEYPAVQSDETSELAFRETLDKLVAVFNLDIIKSSEKIEKMLAIGRQYLALPNGVLASEMGDCLDIICTVGDISDVAHPGDKIPVSGTLCSAVLESDEPVAVAKVSDSQFADTCTGSMQNMQCYIGTQVHTANGPFGTLCFFSNVTRDRPFNTHEIRILKTIASWTGSIIGNDEQLEFLALQNDYYRSLFSTVPSMMMLCNEDGLILSTSDRLCTEIGIESIKIPGQNCQNFFELANKSILTDALKVGEFEQLPLTLCRSNGEKLEVELNSSIKAIGSMQGVRMIVLSDVSERNKAMKAVEEQNKQLALVNQSLNQFASIASHDLQEPLRKIQQFSHFLKEDLGEVMTDDGQYHLDVIVNSAQRMSTLIQDLLEFSSAAKDKLVVTEVALSTLMNEVVSELDLRIEETNAQIELSDLPTVNGDYSLIRQLFTNLVSNSLKYRDESRTPIIKIDALEIDGKLAITVTDNGIGFDQKLAARAFEPFSRLHTDKSYKGNGIGLSICATVCEKHDWKLTACSQPGVGSKFTISMPS